MKDEVGQHSHIIGQPEEVLSKNGILFVIFEAQLGWFFRFLTAGGGGFGGRLATDGVFT